MDSQRYKNTFKIKAIINPHNVGVTDIHKDVYRFAKIHGGIIALDIELRPGEYLYHTDIDESAIDKSVLVEIINETLT